MCSTNSIAAVWNLPQNELLTRENSDALTTVADDSAKSVGSKRYNTKYNSFDPTDSRSYKTNESYSANSMTIDSDSLDLVKLEPTFSTGKKFHQPRASTNSYRRNRDKRVSRDQQKLHSLMADHNESRYTLRETLPTVTNVISSDDVSSYDSSGSESSSDESGSESSSDESGSNDSGENTEVSTFGNSVTEYSAFSRDTYRIPTRNESTILDFSSDDTSSKTGDSTFEDSVTFNDSSSGSIEYSDFSEVTDHRIWMKGNSTFLDSSDDDSSSDDDNSSDNDSSTDNSRGTWNYTIEENDTLNNFFSGVKSKLTIPSCYECRELNRNIGNEKNMLDVESEIWGLIENEDFELATQKLSDSGVGDKDINDEEESLLNESILTLLFGDVNTTDEKKFLGRSSAYSSLRTNERHKGPKSVPQDTPGAKLLSRSALRKLSKKRAKEKNLDDKERNRTLNIIEGVLVTEYGKMVNKKKLSDKIAFELWKQSYEDFKNNRRKGVEQNLKKGNKLLSGASRGVKDSSRSEDERVLHQKQRIVAPTEESRMKTYIDSSRYKSWANKPLSIDPTNVCGDEGVISSDMIPGEQNVRKGKRRLNSIPPDNSTPFSHDARKSGGVKPSLSGKKQGRKKLEGEKCSLKKIDTADGKVANKRVAILKKNYKENQSSTINEVSKQNKRHSAISTNPDDTSKKDLFDIILPDECFEETPSLGMTSTRAVVDYERDRKGRCKKQIVKRPKAGFMSKLFKRIKQA